MIYFIAQGEEFIKIGYTKDDPEGRLIGLQTGNPHKLTLVKSIEGDKDTEETLHSRFHHLHCRGEWFYYTKELSTFIDRATQAGQSIDEYVIIHDGVMRNVWLESNPACTHEFTPCQAGPGIAHVWPKETRYVV